MAHFFGKNEFFLCFRAITWMISVQEQRKRWALDILRFPILSGREMNRGILPDTDHHHVLADVNLLVKFAFACSGWESGVFPGTILLSTSVSTLQFVATEPTASIVVWAVNRCVS